MRNVPEAVKRQDYAEYGITSHQPHEYEVDHLISLELGGSNSIKNLWPESYHGPWNAHIKDRLENELHRRVCSGALDLKEAQREISTNWIEAYKKYLGEPKDQMKDNTPLPQAGAPEKSADASSSVIIGNRHSHVYHRPDCPDYNRVSPENRVEFSSAAEAEQAGYHAAHNCPH